MISSPGYHLLVRSNRMGVVGWVYGGSLALLPWLVDVRLSWAPIVVAAALLLRPLATRTGAAEPWASMVVGVSSAVVIAVRGGSDVAVGWLLLAGLIALIARTLPRRDGGRPDTADVMAVVGWAAVYALVPRLIETGVSSLVAPLLLLVATMRVARTLRVPVTRQMPAPPDREVRGTLSLDGAVMAGADGLPRSVPLDLELRAGDSLAVLVDSPEDAAALSEMLAGRTSAHAGRVMIDGSPLVGGTRLAAVIGPGERFVEGSLHENVSALTDHLIDRESMAAVREACSLAEVVEALEGRSLSFDGEPLSPYHRLLVLAARVIPSSYRLLVVIDPMPWINAVRGELWRTAVVRASVGRTAVWLTRDRELATRATHVVELRGGALRRFSGDA